MTLLCLMWTEFCFYGFSVIEKGKAPAMNFYVQRASVYNDNDILTLKYVCSRL